MTVTPTAASTPLPPARLTGLPPALPKDPQVSGGGESVRHKITSWMETHLGKAAMPVAALAGGAVGGTIGMLTLGPVGAAVGGAGGAFLGAVLFMAG
jgi:hypothetical protein